MLDELKDQQRASVGASNFIRASVVLIFLLFVSCGPLLVRERLRADDSPSQDFKRERQSLVDQLKAEGITNSDVLKAMLEVPRHEFVPPSHRHYSYQNRPLPIGHDQTISQPFIVGYMTQAASIAPGEQVVEIGTGSCYPSAVRAELAVQ